MLGYAHLKEPPLSPRSEAGQSYKRQTRIIRNTVKTSIGASSSLSLAIQPADDADLARRERDAVTVADHGHPCQIDDGAIHLDRVKRFARRGTTAKHPNASEQLTRRERLGHVVVGAFNQASHFVVLGTPCGEDQDRHAGTRRAEPAADLHAVEPRQHEIEHDEIEELAQSGFDTGDTVADRGHDMAVPFEEIDDSVSQAGFVLDHENSHAHTLWHATV